MKDDRSVIRKQQDINQSPIFSPPTPLEMQTFRVFFEPALDEEESEPVETLRNIMKRRPLDLF